MAPLAKSVAFVPAAAGTTVTFSSESATTVDTEEATRAIAGPRRPLCPGQSPGDDRGLMQHHGHDSLSCKNLSRFYAVDWRWRWPLDKLVQKVSRVSFAGLIRGFKGGERDPPKLPDHHFNHGGHWHARPKLFSRGAVANQLRQIVTPLGIRSRQGRGREGIAIRPELELRSAR